MQTDVKARLVVFDMIGTTVEAGPVVSESFCAAFAQAGITLSEDAVEGVRGRSKSEVVGELVGIHASG